MRVKNLILCGLAGGITNFLLGWLFYGILFVDYFASDPMNLGQVFGGCLTFGFLLAYVFVYLADIQTLSGGMSAGATFGFILGIMNNFFSWAARPETDWEKFMFDVALCVVTGAIVGAVIGYINKASKPKLRGAIY